MPTRIRRIWQLARARVRPARIAGVDLGRHVDDLDQTIGRLGLLGLLAHDLSEKLHELRLALSTWCWRRYRRVGAMNELKDAVLGSSGEGR
jgi:hypothetical protein